MLLRGRFQASFPQAKTREHARLTLSPNRA
jgi:hypothetical protein